MSFTAWVVVSRVRAAVLVLVVAQVVVFRPFGSDVVAVVDGDVVAERGGWRCGTGGWWSGRGELGCLGGVLGRCWGLPSWWGGSIEYTTRSDERVRTTSCNGLSWAVDSPCTSFRARWWILGMVAAVWVLDETLAVVSELAVAGITAVVGSDVVLAMGSFECEMGGCRVCRGAIARPGSECRHLQGAGSGFGAGDEVVVVVDDVVGVDDSWWYLLLSSTPK